MTDIQPLDSLLSFKDTFMNKQRTETQKSDGTLSELSSNQAILRSFKELRQKLKVSQKQNSNLQEESKINQIRIKQSQQALQTALANNIQLKDQVCKDAQSIKELKRRFLQMKDQLYKYNDIEKDLSFTKAVLCQTKIKESSLLVQKQKLIELHSQQKIQLQEEIVKLKVKIKSDEDFINELKDQSFKSKEAAIKIENTMRKMSISFQEESQNGKWTRQNFQTQHLLETISCLEKEIQSVRLKYCKEKQRRFQLQEQIIEVQQAVNLNTIKACSFEGQSQILLSKQAKLKKKVASLNEKINVLSDKNLKLEESQAKYKSLSQAILSKIKSKNSQEFQQIYLQFADKLQSIALSAQDKMSITEIPKKMNKEEKFLVPLQEKNVFPSSVSDNVHKRYQSNQCEFAWTTEDKFVAENVNLEKAAQFSGMETRIRRQRDEMEKKLKEKLFHQKYECSLPNQHYRLRSEYLSSFADQWQ